MACYRPIPAYQAGPGSQPVLWPQLGLENMELPCGKCIGCKTANANQWAQRCEHEATKSNLNIFLTLTYADEHLPYAGYLDAKELQRFIKRLRKSSHSRHSSLQSNSGTIRYFACGEYGTQNGRPHYHILVFDCDFSDRFKIGERRGKPVYDSYELQRLWPYGRREFGVATPGGANYIAQYSLKKQYSPRTVSRDGYNGEYAISQDGELLPKPAPFLRMSLKPAIGADWLAKYKEDLLHGYLVSNGRKFAIPRTYRKRLELQDPALAEEIAIRTINHRRSYTTDANNPERRHASEVIHARRKQLTENRNL